MARLRLSPMCARLGRPWPFAGLPERNASLVGEIGQQKPWGWRDGSLRRGNPLRGCGRFRACRTGTADDQRLSLPVGFQGDDSSGSRSRCFSMGRRNRWPDAHPALSEKSFDPREVTSPKWQGAKAPQVEWRSLARRLGLSDPRPGGAPPWPGANHGRNLASCLP